MLAYIRKLFAIESKADDEEITLEERLKLRQEKSKVILDEFYKWINTVEHKTLHLITWQRNLSSHLL